MTKFLDQTRERFLLAIASQLPAERFLELHFFQPIRQGGIESGVAVIAAFPEPQPGIIVADAPPAEEPATQSEANETRRYTVYSARYKLVLKGPDRGRWECAVVAEADAPLVTVESVVRGVMRRSGDAEEPERMAGDEARDYVLASTRGSVA